MLSDELHGASGRVLAGEGGRLVIDVAVTREPTRMLPAGNRTLGVTLGDRPAGKVADERLTVGVGAHG